MAITPPDHPDVHLRCIYVPYRGQMAFGSEYTYIWCKRGANGGIWAAEWASHLTGLDLSDIKIPWHATVAKAREWAKLNPYVSTLEPTPEG